MRSRAVATGWQCQCGSWRKYWKTLFWVIITWIALLE
jgi:hypothetical protein